MSSHPLIIGDSHGVFMAQQFGELNVPNAWKYDQYMPIEIKKEGEITGEFLPILNSELKFFDFTDGSFFINEKYKSIIDQRKINWTHCLISLEGNQHNANFMIKGENPFDFFDPNLPNKFSEKYQIIPRECIKNHFRNTLLSLKYKLVLIHSLISEIKIYFVLPPPPIPSEIHILQYPEIFRFENYEINNEYVRLKIYLVFISIIREYCEQLGIQVLCHPNDCLDEFGFLKKEFWNQCTHAQPSFYSYLNLIN